MKYDPIKRVFGDVVSGRPLLRKIFYFILDVMFLRSWYVRGIIRKLYPKNTKMKILDAGMGFGQYTYFMAKRFPGSKILAVDVKTEQIEDCRKFFNETGFNNVEVEYADLTNMDFENEFDFILCVDVMEHIEEDELVFKNYHRALKNGGKVLINTPSDLGGSDVKEEGDTSFIEEHARDGYSREEITTKLNNAGLDVELFEYAYGKFGTISWRFGIKYPILMAGYSKLLILVLPFYYLVTIWFVLILMWLDLNTDDKTGTGISLVAVKKN